MHGVIGVLVSCRHLKIRVATRPGLSRTSRSPRFETLCPASRMNTHCPGFRERPRTHREFASMIQIQCRNFSKNTDARYCYSNSVCLSVRPTVRPSVRDTLVMYENGLTYRHSFFSPYGSPIILVLPASNIFTKFRRGHPLRGS